MLASCFFSDLLMFFLFVDVILRLSEIRRTNDAIRDRIFLINWSRRQRRPVAVSKGTLAPISFPRVQMLYGIVRQRLHDCSIASQARPLPNRTSNTRPIFRGLLWRALRSIPRAAREHLRLPRRD